MRPCLEALSTISGYWNSHEPSFVPRTSSTACTHVALHETGLHAPTHTQNSAAFDISRETPTLADMRRYKSIIVSLGGVTGDWNGALPSALTFRDAVALGNRLADYVDEGYGVVIAGPSLWCFLSCDFSTQERG
jgi:hypothetical protein